MQGQKTFLFFLKVHWYKPEFMNENKPLMKITKVKRITY